MIGSRKPTSRYDYDYLWHILDTAVRLYPGTNDEERIALADHKDFLTWLCMEAVENESEAKIMTQILVRLLEEIKDTIECYRFCRLTPIGLVHHGRFIQALLLTLTRKHSIHNLLCRDINHHAFLESWEQTKYKLGLCIIENDAKIDGISTL